MVRRESPARPTGKLDPVATWPGRVPAEPWEALNHHLLVQTAADPPVRQSPSSPCLSLSRMSNSASLALPPGAPAPGTCGPWYGRWWCSRLTRGMPTPQARQGTPLSFVFVEPCTEDGRSPGSPVTEQSVPFSLSNFEFLSSVQTAAAPPVRQSPSNPCLFSLPVRNPYTAVQWRREQGLDN